MPALSDCFLCRAIKEAIDCYTRTPKHFRLGLQMVADPNTMCYHLKCRSFETFKCFTQYSKAVNGYSSHPILVPSPLPRSIGYTGRHYIGRCRCSQGTGRPHYGRNHCGRDRLARFIGWWRRKGVGVDGTGPRWTRSYSSADSQLRWIPNCSRVNHPV